MATEKLSKKQQAYIAFYLKAGKFWVKRALFTALSKIETTTVKQKALTDFMQLARELEILVPTAEDRAALYKALEEEQIDISKN